MFAARLLAPACVLWGLGVQSAEDIAAICNISYSAASIRFRRLETLRERNSFFLNPLEQKVYDNFKEYMQNYNR